jgi:flagellin-like protein
MRHIKRNLRAISPVLAVLMMIAVAIAGSLVTYAWVMGYIGFTTEKSGKALMIQSVVNDGTDTDLMVYVQNVGEGTVELEETSCLYVNGALEPCTITGVTKTGTTAKLGEGDTATLTFAGGAAAAGEKKTVKVVSALGTFSEMSTYPAEGSGGGGPVAPVLDHFTFDPISSPQTSGAAFGITITARDQYGAAFTSYTGTNTLSYSAGTISPTTTTAFTAGVWTGSVTVTGSGTGVTIGTSAQATPSITGTSNAFNVDAPTQQVIFVSAGTGSGIGGPNGNPTPGYPSGLQLNDLILLQVVVRGDPAATVTQPAGFTLLYGPDPTGGTSARVTQWIYYKFSNGMESGTATVTISQPSGIYGRGARMYAFRNVALTSFTEGTNTNTANSATILPPSVTTLGVKRLAVSFEVLAGDPQYGNQGLDSFTGESGGDWALAAPRFVYSGYSGDHHFEFGLQTATMANAGTISGGSDYIAAYYWFVRSFALIPR